MKYKAFHLTIRVEGVEADDEPGATLTVKFRDIPREAVMSDDYPPNIRALAQNLEFFTKEADNLRPL